MSNAFVGTASPFYVEHGHFYLESNNIKNGQINHDHEVFINDTFYNEQRNKHLHTNDLVMVQSGHVGDSAVITKRYNNIAAHALIMFQNPKYSETSRFLNYYFQSYNAKKKISVISIGNTISHILASDMNKFITSFPKSSEQQKIATIFQRIQDLISLQQRKLKLIKVELSAILQQLLSQKSTWPNYKLSQVVSIQDNKRVPVKRQDRISGPIPYYGANGVQDYVDGYTHKGDLILIAEDGANSLTNYPIYFVNGKIWANNHTHVLRPNKEVNPLFLTVTLKQINYSKYVVGGSRYKLNLEDLKSIKLNIPNRAQQDKIGGIYNKFYQVQLKKNHKLKLLHKIKHFLLQNMFI
ncbi:restriction endonuclease subunit S [Lactobacillus amylovorus]|uniref:restriction endonuclease subunit S n=1 Tax=Lactobacillus amylovorus TaxID=1604 RepID=UPI001F574F3E|nr:restriction endonuclease subunit S [Lactobacillus amylovorus]